MAALGRKKDGSIDLESLDPKKLYSNGKLNEDLWKALYALPKAYITDGMAAAGVRAIEEMALGTYNNDNPDYKSIQTVLKWAFPSDGKTTSHTPGVQPVTHTGFYVPGYGHKKGPFLSCLVKVADDLVRSGDTSNLFGQLVMWGMRGCFLISTLLAPSLLEQINLRISKGFLYVWLL